MIHFFSISFFQLSHFWWLSLVFLSLFSVCLVLPSFYHHWLIVFPFFVFQSNLPFTSSSFHPLLYPQFSFCSHFYTSLNFIFYQLYTLQFTSDFYTFVFGTLFACYNSCTSSILYHIYSSVFFIIYHICTSLLFFICLHHSIFLLLAVSRLHLNFWLNLLWK